MMRQSPSWRTGFLFVVLLALAAYAWLDQELPRVVRQSLAVWSGGALRVGGVRLGLPMRLVLTDVSLAAAVPGATLSARKLVAVPGSWSISKRTVRLSSLLVEGLHAEIRRTQQGAILWPMLDVPVRADERTPLEEAVVKTAVPALGVPVGLHWQLVIDTLQIVDADVVLLDQRLSHPFEWSLSPVSLIGGPVRVPRVADRFSLAAQGWFLGAFRHGAPLSCSGWLDFLERDADIACQLSPLSLSAFQPYYDQSPWQVRVYNASIEVTARVTARQNALEGRLQLELAHLEEGDVSRRGRTVVDVKKVLNAAAQKTLSGEIRLTGPLDRPEQWQFQLVPGNDTVQQLMRPLLERGVASIQLKMGEQVINVGLTPGSPDVLTDVGQAIQDVQDQLQVVHPAEAAPAPTTSEPSSAAPPAAPAVPSADAHESPASGSSPVAEPAEIR